MDYPANRQKYLTVFPDYLEKVVLNESLISEVRRFSPALWETNKNPSNESIKSYILLELTKTRESCAKIIHFLIKSKEAANSELANGLVEFNTSPGRRDYGYATYIPVTPVLQTEVKHPNTRNYSMTRKPRGKAIIFNIVPTEVVREAYRFYYIFEQLLFDVQMHINLTTTQIKHQLHIISNEMIEREGNDEERDEALIVMVITHGGDDKICGRNHPACSKIQPSDPRFLEAVLDITPISDVVDIFAPTNDLDIVKMFFFICCRESNHYIGQDNYYNIFYLVFQSHQNPKDKKCYSRNDTNTDSFVYYSCAEGYETPIQGNSLYTPYGKALSESIAQYAHSEHLAEIMNRTYQELRKNMKGIASTEKGQYAASNDDKSVTGKVYFNPGYYENKEL